MKKFLAPIAAAMFFLLVASVEAGCYGRSQFFGGGQAIVLGNNVGGQQAFNLGARQIFSIGGGCNGGQSIILGNNGFNRFSFGGFNQQQVIIRRGGFGRQQVIIIPRYRGLLGRLLGGF